MAAYVIANIHVTDPERYEEYKRQAQATIAAYGGRYLVRGGKHEVLEGHWAPARLVILEFDSYERAVEWYESQEYDSPKAFRRSISVSEIVVVEGR
ncbi:MAG: DUF1330 domain-containing protein [Candidatus Eremiobacteraeota bacterium]|nr:DUF1330 domain-containing protein [Candidatus Eremiobacteraeota bacterium]MBV8285025.1 DUF1330 domain-containing protein [Candidatus Eremiobacteraeota bacterium]MBV8333304.1 DUF1330 domain-containing protein [Candidatus Eremiobacteraeota bacterium]MBV8435680.1 DUF1330 domain-containing protein [Candidatus Eremiobacteraeota bacterium]MBV8656066.1 DUF1330 domain-containing protein [Candidatus Eremiobacteraeota bacterium]